MNFYSAFPFIIGAFILGFSHAFDPDHIAVMSNYVYKSKNYRRSAIMGIFWGSGHTAALMLVGSLILIFRVEIPDYITGYFEYLVGIVLLGFGVNIFYKLHRSRTHLHLHEHEGKKHLHFHSHSEQISHNHSHRSFLFGVLHGLAGTSALMLIVLSSIDTYELGIAFILIFGIGSIVGMLLFSLVLWLSLNLTFKSFPFVNRGASFLTAIFSLIVGSKILFF